MKHLKIDQVVESVLIASKILTTSQIAIKPGHISVEHVEASTYMIYMVPVPYVTQTKADSWKGRPAVERYHMYRTQIWELIKHGLIPKQETRKFNVSFMYGLDMATNRMRKEIISNGFKNLNTDKDTKPDLTNLLKSFEDCILPDSRIKYAPFETRGDSFISKVVIEKYFVPTECSYILYEANL